jgi:uncharacterized repeat protein (TIGR01451 family)
MSGVVAVVTVLICSPAFATAYTSNNSGDWSVGSTWTPAAVPGLGDTVTITGSHVITVSDPRSIDFVTFLNNSGNKELHVTSTGSLTVAGSGAAIQLNPSTDGVNLLQLEGGTVTLTDPLGSVNVVGGGLSIAQIRFTSLGGTLTIARSLNFSGTAVNADVIFDAGSTGNLEIGGDLNAGGNITTAGSAGTFTFNGAGNSQTINDYSFQNLTVNKSSGTATMNGTGTAVVNGNLTITSGVLDDGGNQLNLDSGLGSLVTIGANGVLKLGSAANGTSFPNPVNPINVNLAPNSAVVYQSGNSQSVDTSFDYKRLYLQTLGGPVVRSFVNQTLLKVIEQLFIDSTVTASFDNDLLDVDGDITGTGTVQLLNSVSPGNAEIAGDWSTGVLSSAPGTTVTYDGSGPQTMLGATYQNLTINKPSGDATVNTSANVFGTLNLSNGNVVVNLSFTIDVAANVTRTSGHFIGPLTMGLNPSPLRRFEVGTAASYLPVDIDAGSSGFVTIQAVEGPHPNNTGINTLDRYWSIVAPSTVAPLDSAQFYYNDPGDITNGDETKFRLARYSGGIWTDFGDIPETLNYGLATSPAPYLGDWVIGQRGSTGFAGKVAITSVNGGSDPTVNVGFPVDVQSQHDDGTPANVTVTTGVDILYQAGAGSLLGGFASITSGTSSATASNSTYDTIDSNVQVRADASSGDTSLDDGVSAPFDVMAPPSTLTVTTIADNGAGTLRDAITIFNSGGCPGPCIIEFDVNGTGNIVLASALPAITGTGPLTIDGYSGFASSPNTNAFGLPVNSVITVSLDGNNAVAFGLVIQTNDVTVKGIGFRRFNFGGSGEAVKIDNVTGCTIAGNFIGTDNSGMTAQPNFFGVVLNGAGAMLNTVGGAAPADRNLIAGNASWGVFVFNGANDNDIAGNYIGLRADAGTGLANGNGGVTICATCTDNQVGTSGVGNVISGHTSGIGVEINGSDTYVVSNRIGTKGDGTGPVANSVGIVINADDTYIGGFPGDGNLISGNSTNGITINSSANQICGNWIGTEVTGTSALPNNGHGIALTGAAAQNEIGSPVANRIAFNTMKGVELNTTGIGNIIRGNPIFSNTGMAIDLGTDGPTANDATDADTGPNNRQNFPTVSSAQITGGNVDVTVSLNSSAGVNANYFTVNVYRADASVTPQAAEHLGVSACLDTLTTGILTNQVVSVPVGGLTVGGKIVVTATAFSDAACTAASEGTSELSPGFTVSGDVHWINAAGGAWETGANWDTGFIPGPGDNAIIDAPGTYTVTLSSGQTIQGLTVGTGISGVQTLSVNVGPLTLNAGSTVTSTGFLAAANSIQGTGTITNNGTMIWSFGTLAVAGVTNNTVNFTISGASPKTLNGTVLTNSAGGAMSWSGGTLNFMNSGGINNAGSFLIANDMGINNAGSGGPFTNTGTFTRQGLTGSTFVTVPFNHSGGQINVQLGSLQLSTGTASAPIDITGGAKVVINGTYTLASGVSFTGAGKVEVPAAGVLTVNTAVNFPALHMTGGTVDGSGDVGATTSGQINWDSGTFGTGGGKVSLSGSGVLQISTPAPKTLNRTLELISPSATAVWNNGTIDIFTNGLVNNGGTFESQADTFLNNSGVGAATFTNTGTFKKSGGAGSTFFQNVPLVSSNTLWVASGTVNLANATISGTVDIDAGKTLLVDSDAVTLNSATFVDSGLLQVNGGTLTMNGPIAVSTFQFDNGIVNGIGNVSHGGPFQWNGGTLSGTGTSSIITGGSLAIAGGLPKTLDRTLTISSGRTATWSGGTINVFTNGNVNNIGTFDATTDNVMNKSGGGTPTLTNSGTLRKSGGAGQTMFTNVDLASTGTIQVQTGSINPSNASISGTVDLDPGTKLTVDSDTVTISGATSFPDTGSVDLQGGTFTVNSNVTVPVLNFNNGILDGTAVLTIGSTCVWGGGTMQGSGATEVANGATLTMTGIGKALNTRTLRPLTGSTVNWNAGNLSVNTGGNINNTGLFHVQFDGNIGNAGTAGGFLNNNGGTLRKSATTGSLTLTGINLTNNGILDIDAGKVDVSGTFIQGATGSLDVLLGGAVPGTQYGQLVTNSGPILAGPLNVTFNGPYQPQVNDDFVIVSWPSDTHAGDFAPYNLPGLVNGRTWSNFFNASGLHLVVNGGNADVSIVKTAPANVVAGNPIVYTLAVSNAGPDVANSVQVTDTLPAGHTGITAFGGPTWSCGVSVLTVTCNAVSPLNTGAAPTITVNANAPLTPGPIMNTASVTTSNPDPVAPNNSSNASVTVDPSQADLAVNGANPSGVPVGSPVAFNFTITNNGPQTATSVIFTAPIPATLTFVSATPPCVFSVGTVTCNLGNLASAGSTGVTINTTAPSVGTQSITGSADANEADPTPANDSKTLSVTVSGATVVVTNTNDSGAGSLRQALLDAQSAVCTSPCAITFNIPAPPFVIQPATNLPGVASNTTVDGTTQPGYAGIPIVEVDGNLISSGGTFILGGTNAKLTGLAITNSNAGAYGIRITGTGNFVEANYIGLDPLGAADGNNIGIRVDGNNNKIGGSTPAKRNIISGNSTGVLMANPATGNLVSGNYIGIDPTGTATRPNGVGIDIAETDANIVGGALPADGNVISGNSTFGVVISGTTGLVADDNVVNHNVIGPNAGGTAALGNLSAGIIVDDYADSTVISNNVISGNQKAIVLNGALNTNSAIAGNSIGFAPDGTTPMGNPLAGIYISASSNARVGGLVAGEPNVIAHNGNSGIIVIAGAGNTILGNSIHSHPQLGIDLGNDGVTANVAGDADTGPNNLQNSPTLTLATLNGVGGMTIAYNIDSSATSAGSILVEFFEGDGTGEGKTFITRTCQVGNVFGAGTSFAAPGFISAGDTVVATATAYSDTGCTTVADGTSEFSNAITVTNCTPPPATIGAPASVCSTATNVSANVVAPTAVSYNWVATNATIATGQGTSAITFNAGASGSVMLSVTVTDANGCVSTTSTTFPITPLPVVNIAGPAATCSGTPVVLDAGPFASWAWNTGATTQTITVSPTSTQIYSVTVTDANGCTASDTHTVNVSSNPVATITAPPSVCQNSTGHNASVPTQAGATYAWTITNGSFTSATNAAAVTFTAGPSGNVGLGVTITVGSCTSVGSSTIPIVPPPVVTITGPTQVCPNVPFSLNAGAGFSTYLWSNGATSQSIVVSQSLASQVYSVTVTSAGGAGCSSTDSHTVTLSSGPSATITAPSSVSPNTAGHSASVPAQPGATYFWAITNGSITSGQGTDTILFAVTGSGVTQLSVEIALSGCSAFGTHNVTVGGPVSTLSDVGITKSAAASVQAGGTLAYVLTVTNNGPGSAPDVTIVDPLPGGTSLLSIDDGTFNCASFANGIICDGSLFPGSSAIITVTVTAPLNVPPQGLTLTNTATVDAGDNDTNPANDVATAQTLVLPTSSACATTPPSLLPANAATTSSPVTFSWSAVSGFVDAYELWIVTEDATSLAGTTDGTSLTIPLASGQAGWYVIARMAGDCPPLVSAQRTVNVALANGCATHGTPQLTSPAANSTLTSPVSFSWTPVPQAIGYRVWVEVSGTAAQDVGTTDGAIMLTADVPPGAIAAHVDALFSGCPDTQSAALAFRVARPDPCAGRTTVTPLAPANNSTVNSSVVNFSWTETNADGYRLWVSIDGATPEAVATTEDTSLQTTIGHGVVAWWVETLYDGCGSTESQHFRFTIPLQQSCGTTVSQLLSPANGSTVTNANVTFNWTSVPNAVSYELWLSVGSTTPTLIGTTSSTSLTRLVPPGALEWFVRAIVDRCPPRDSAHARFTFTTPAACRDDQPPHAIAPLPDAQVVSPVDFSWTPRPGATTYDLFVVRGSSAPQLILSTTSPFANNVALEKGNIRWFVRVHFADCSPLDSAARQLEITGQPQPCADLAPPVISAPGQISNDEPFLLQWNPIPGATAYQLQTANNSAFAGAELLTTGETSTTLTRTNHGSAPLGVFARVRAIDTRCSPATVTPYGPTGAIFILPEGGSEGSTPLAGGIVTHFINLGPELAGQSFLVTVKEPWLTVAPSSGVVAPGGTALLITANTTDLPLGTSLGSVQIALTSSARGIGTQATTFKLPTMSVSKVTPVTPAPKSTPPPDALIIPAVAHANGINSQFQSDVRVTNSSAQLLDYQATFTPSGGDGLAAGRQTTFSIEPGRTIALDDVLRGWFGTGGESVTGTLEVRPITETAPSTSSAALSGLANLVTFAASRTFNVTANGTFGQYIPAIPFANFIGGADGLAAPVALSLQQIAQSDRYRTNLGIVEASGDPASLLVKVFGSDGQKLTEFPVELAGGQHTQLNSFLATHGVGSLSDGRVEISVVGGGGKVTAYASVLDNLTSDPLLVTPVTLSDTGNTKWVIPGVADLNNGVANWQTDMRLFNAGTSSVGATLTFYSQNGGTPRTAQITIAAGEVRQFDKTLASVFGATNDGGAVHITTSTATRLVATARTYNQTTGGTYGQFISGVTPGEATGVGSRPLQILQVEESNRFRSNVGLAEVTGKPVKLEITVVPPDAKVTVVTEVQLQANEFRQINSLLRSVGLADTYNARVSVRAIEGEGRVTAYASVIDMLTNDPTYVPAQ